MAEILVAREPQIDTDVTVNKAIVTKGKYDIHVESRVFTLHRTKEVAVSDDFTRATFEDALDKVSRPVKGKYADALPSSEEYIRDKRREAELEDRQP